MNKKGQKFYGGGSPNISVFKPTMSLVRSSHKRCYVKKGALTNFAKFTGKHLCQSLFLNKVAGLRQK